MTAKSQTDHQGNSRTSRKWINCAINVQLHCSFKRSGHSTGIPKGTLHDVKVEKKNTANLLLWFWNYRLVCFIRNGLNGEFCMCPFLRLSELDIH